MVDLRQFARGTKRSASENFPDLERPRLAKPSFNGSAHNASRGWRRERGELDLRGSSSRAASSGHRVINARISNLHRPDLNPLGGLTVEDIHMVFSQAGLVEKIVCATAPKTGPPLVHVDAMVQFASPEYANRALKEFHGCSLSGDEYNTMSLQYSTHSELTTQSNSRCRDYTAPTAFDDRRSNTLGHEQVRQRRTVPVREASEQFAHRVLLARMTDLRTPEHNPLGGLTVDDVHDRFSAFGIIEKIVCASQPKTGPPLRLVEAMVQYASPEDAMVAVDHLQGESCTVDGFFTMDIQFSTQGELWVKSNNDRCRDYTLDAEAEVASEGVVVPSHTRPGKSVRVPAITARLPQAEERGQRVVVAHIVELHAPWQNPLGGLTLDTVHDAFEKYGAIERIVCSTQPKGPPLQTVDAMVQFASAKAAAASFQLDGQSLTQDDHNIISMEYSQRKELTVLANNNRARDYLLL